MKGQNHSVSFGAPVDAKRGSGAAVTKCWDPNCLCQKTNLPEPNAVKPTENRIAKNG